MTMPLGVRQRVRRMDADEAGPTEAARHPSATPPPGTAGTGDLSPAPPLAPEGARPAAGPFAGWVPEVLAACLLGYELRPVTIGHGIRKLSPTSLV